MIVYLAYFTDERGTKMSSSFGWTDNLKLVEMYIKTHRLMTDDRCKPHIDKIRIKKDDFDDLYNHMRDMNFYPYTPDVTTDTRIQLTYLDDDGGWWNNGNALTVVTTNETLYHAVGLRVILDPSIYNPTFDDYRSDNYSSPNFGWDMDTSIEACKLVHWLVTGNVIKQSWISNLLEKATVRVGKCNVTSYQEFDSIKYCVMVGYINPVR